MRLGIRTRYSRISDRRLDSEVRDICDQHPYAGYRMVSAYLRACVFGYKKVELGNHWRELMELELQYVGAETE